MQFEIRRARIRSRIMSHCARLDERGLIMTGFKQALSVFLSISLMLSVMGLEGCKKKAEQAQPGETQQGQAPATTYAVPTADQLYQLVAPIALFPTTWLPWCSLPPPIPTRSAPPTNGCSRTRT